MSTAPELHENGRFRPTEARIDLDAFSANLDTVVSLLPEGARLIAVLKANAYGHGAVELARRCDPGRVAMIAVALLEEALELRRAGITLPVLVLGPLDEKAIATSLEEQIDFALTGPEVLREVPAGTAVHLKLDSGMGRMGFLESDLVAAAETIRAKGLRVVSIYTHFANADEEDDDFTAVQIANYDAMLERLRDAGIDAPLHHFANSAATLRRLVRPGDYARTGIVLYGPGNGPTRPVMRWRTAIARLKTLPAGHAIGYGTTFHTTRTSRIATLPVGYADGYSRRNSNCGVVLVRGQRVPVVGRVSMDLVTIDVTGVEGVAPGDEVVLLGDGITADEIASRIGTISYEVFCNVSARVPRVFA
jgi:alanine racemase